MSDIPPGDLFVEKNQVTMQAVCSHRFHEECAVAKASYACTISLTLPFPVSHSFLQLTIGQSISVFSFLSDSEISFSSSILS